MDLPSEGRKDLISQNSDSFLVDQRTESTENNLNNNVFSKELFENKSCSYFNLGNLRFPSDSTVEKMLCVINDDSGLCSSNPFKLSSIWILLPRDCDCELLTLEDVEVLLPNNGCNLMISKSYIVSMHFTPTVVDHYSKEISKLLAEEKFFINLDCNAVISQITCLPIGSKVTFFVVNDEHYKSWMTGKKVERCSMLVQNMDLKEVLYELENMKELFRQSEENIKNNVIRYITLKEEDVKSIVDAVNFHLAGIKSATETSDKLSTGVTNKWLIDAAKNIKESKVSVASLVQCNNLLIAENANICHKYEKLKMKFQYGDTKSKEQLSTIKDDFSSQSNERLRFKLVSLLNQMEELQFKLLQSERQNAALSEKYLKLRLEKEQQNLKLTHEISNYDIEIARLKKEITDKDHILKRAVCSGKILLEDIRSTENILQYMGEDLQISHYDARKNTDDLSEMMNTFRNCIKRFSDTVLSAHTKAESSDRSLNQIKTEFTRVSEKFVNLNEEVCGLREKLNLLSSENMKLLNSISILADENCSMQDQLSQSNYKNIILNEQLNDLWKQQNKGEGDNLENKINSEKLDTSFEENINSLKLQVDELVNEKYKLLERVYDAEAKAKKYQCDLQHKELLLYKTIENYEMYIAIMKKESDGRETELKDSQQLLNKFITGVQMEHATFVEQMESMIKENSSLLRNHLDQKNEEVKELKGAAENLSLMLSEERYENTEMKHKLEQINNIQKIFSEEEINFEAEIQKVIENEFNETLIVELDSCLSEKENLIKTLLSQGQSDKNKIKQIGEHALRWKKQLHICKALLKEYKNKRNEIVRSQNVFFQTLKKTIEKKKLKCEILSKECHQKTMEIARLEKELEGAENKYENLKSQCNAYSKDAEKELSIARKRLSEYEKHVCILDKELERQVNLVKDTLNQGALEKKDLEDQVIGYADEIILLKSTISEKEKEIFELKEKCKDYENELVAANETVSEWKLKCSETEEIVVSKKNKVKALENDKKKVEDMLISYNKTASDLIMEQRKVSKLENDIQLLEQKVHELENKLQEKEDLLQYSYNDLQSLREELNDMKICFRENSHEFFLLESKHNQEKMKLEVALSKCINEKNAIENSYRTICREKAEILKDHDALCDKLINAIHMLMENKLVQERMGGQIKELSETVAILMRQKI